VCNSTIKVKTNSRITSKLYKSYLWN